MFGFLPRFDVTNWKYDFYAEHDNWIPHIQKKRYTIRHNGEYNDILFDILVQVNSTWYENIMEDFILRDD